MTATDQRHATGATDLAGGLPGIGGGGSTPGGVHPIVRAVHDCLRALEQARNASTLSLSAEEIRVLLLGVVQIIGRAVALKLKLLVAGDSKRVAETTGASSTAAFLAHLTQTNRRVASGDCRIAADLEHRFPVLGDALAAGGVSFDQVRVCVQALRRLPKDLPAHKLAECQQFLVEAARHADPDALYRIGRRLWEVIDPDTADEREGRKLQDEEDLARARAYFKSWRNGDGSTSFKGKLPDAQFDMLLKALHAYTSPRRRSNPNIRTTGGINKPEPKPDPGPPNPEGSGPGPPEPFRPRLFSHPDDPGHTEPDTGRRLPYPVLLGHGLIDLIEHLPADALPRSGGLAATVVVTLDHEKLLTGLGAATLDTGTKISAAQARRMACESGIIPMVLGGPSEPLDVGREQRLHTKSQRIAMAHRDQGCVAEGCDRPAAWTEAHHRIPWEHGGRTDIDTGCLVCSHHHRLWHHPDWTTRTLPDGKVRFRRRSHRRTEQPVTASVPWATP